jgi:type IV secretion system protein VirB10
VALEPPSLRLPTQPEPGEPRPRETPDALANAPRTYGAVPKLGPPLPGDLGGSIVDQQRQLQAQDAADAAEAERERVEAAREAARAAGVFAPLTGAQARRAIGPTTGAQPGGEMQPLASSEPSQAGRRVMAFGRAASVEVSAHAIAEAASPWTLSAGTIIAASLITGLSSDIPGTVLAQVTQPVRDSATGRVVLIPQGARLIGRYDSVVAFGQRRVLVVWQRIMFPDGASVQLDNVPATDSAGLSGLEDEVDLHGWQLLKGIGLSTLLGVGTRCARAPSTRRLGPETGSPPGTSTSARP